MRKVWRVEHAVEKCGPFSNVRGAPYAGGYVQHHRTPQDYDLSDEDYMRRDLVLNQGGLFAWDSVEMMNWFVRCGWRGLQEAGYVIVEVEVEDSNAFIFDDGQTIFLGGRVVKTYSMKAFLIHADDLAFGGDK